MKHVINKKVLNNTHVLFKCLLNHVSDQHLLPCNKLCLSKQAITHWNLPFQAKCPS